MKTARIIAVAAIVVGLTLAAGHWLATAAQQAASGALEFVARATPSGGRPEPAQQAAFWLLRKSFGEIQKEADAAIPPPDLDKFVDGLEQLSPELKSWMKKNRAAQLTGTEFMSKMKLGDVLEVPEFFDAFLSVNAPNIAVGFPRAKYSEADREKNPERYEKQKKEFRDSVKKFLETYPHSRDGMDIHLLTIDPGIRWSQREAARKSDVRHRALELAQTRYLVARVETDIEGRASLGRLAAGDYWLGTLENEVVAGDVRLRWDLPVTVRAGETRRIELSNINAVQPARAGK